MVLKFGNYVIQSIAIFAFSISSIVVGTMKVLISLIGIENLNLMTIENI